MQPEFTIANVVTPYYDNSTMESNSEDTGYTYNPIDTLEANKPSTTRYALIIGESDYIPGRNELKMEFRNYNSDALPFMINLMVVTDSLKIEAAIPIDTLSITSNNSWTYDRYIDGKPSNNWKSAATADQFGFNKDQWYEMEQTQAEPVCVSQDDKQDTLKVIFKKDFEFTGTLKSGQVQFIAPDSATILINGKELAVDYLLNYDPESNLVFSGLVTITPEVLVQGKNSIEVIVTNQSQWKGLVAAITLVAAHPERGEQ